VDITLDIHAGFSLPGERCTRRHSGYCSSLTYHFCGHLFRNQRDQLFNRNLAGNVQTTHCISEDNQMKTNLTKFSIIAFLCLLFLLFPGRALAAGSTNILPDQFVFGDNFTLESGEIMNGNLFVFGGNATLEQDSLLNGFILLFGGNLEIFGTVDGSIALFGGNVMLGPTAVVEGDINALGGSVDRDPGAVIEGQVNTNQEGPFWIIPFSGWSGLSQEWNVPGLNTNWFAGYNPFVQLLWGIVRTFLWAVFAMLVVMLLTKPTERVASTVVKQPLASGGLGCLTAIVVPLVIVVLAITICFIPVSLLLALALVIAWAFGVIAIGLELGKRIAVIFKGEWHPALAAGVGTFILVLVMYGIDAVIPCVGWLPKLIVAILGIGAVLLTRFGSQPYPSEGETIPALPPQSRPEERHLQQNYPKLQNLRKASCRSNSGIT
jgi:hypothetical protein